MHAQFPMGGTAMMNPLMHSASGRGFGKRSNGRGQKKNNGSNRVGGGRGRSAGRGSGSPGNGDGDIASIVAGLVGKLDAGTVVGTAVGDKTSEGNGGNTNAGVQQ